MTVPPMAPVSYLDIKAQRGEVGRMPDAVARFSGYAEQYDRARPSPPDDLVELLTRWAGTEAPVVVDLGAGTGLSTAGWPGHAARVVAVEPSADMREVARRRFAASDAAVELLDATAEDTGLSGGCADVVTASQAMHWFDPGRAAAEVARILRPGGVFAAYDCRWPPCVDAEVDAAYAAFDRLTTAAELRLGLRPPHAGKSGHLARLRDSGLFRQVTEIALHKRDAGDGDRLVDVALSQGGVVALRAAGVAESDIGLARLREVAARRLPGVRPWWWTYRIRLAVR